MENKNMKKVSTLLFITEMQIKAIMKYHFTTTILEIIKNKTKNKTISVTGDVGKFQISYISDGNVKCGNRCGKWFDSFSKIQQFHSWRHTQENCSHQIFTINVYNITIHYIVAEK